MDILKKYFCLISVMTICSGCTVSKYTCSKIGAWPVISPSCEAVDTFRDDYLQVDELTVDKWKEAMHSLKIDYLGFEESDKDIVWKAELMAYDEMLTTDYKDDYEVLDPVVDKNLSMPRAYPYIFVHFLPRDDIENVKGIPSSHKTGTRGLNQKTI